MLILPPVYKYILGIIILISGMLSFRGLNERMGLMNTIKKIINLFLNDFETVGNINSFLKEIEKDELLKQ